MLATYQLQVRCMTTCKIQPHMNMQKVLGVSKMQLLQPFVFKILLSLMSTSHRCGWVH